ncbi:MAG: DNA replication/repair protein RecF [Clostridia bacterium]
MMVEKLELTNFRNYGTETIFFTDGLNIVCGLNAQGKTNLLEAILFCCIGKSLRANKDNQVVNFLKDTARIRLTVKKKYGKTTIEIIFPSEGKKTIKINDIPIKKIGELMGEFNAIFFSPDELKLVKEKPEDRRRFMDIHISQLSKKYFYLLSRYEKILANRNKLFKSGQSELTISETLGIWNQQLASVGSEIVFFRLDFIKKLTPLCEKVHSYLSGGKEKIEIQYIGEQGETKEEIEKKILTNLEKAFEKELKLGFTTIGPHRDDIKILINNIDVRAFGSQGQQRTSALSLKLSEIEIINGEKGETPVLLLDDVLSELDESRRKKLLKFSEKTQTIITTVEKLEQDEMVKANIIKIENGKVIKN